ncbi:hypothetical protein [Aquimarina rhabdastrellae]
MKNKSRVWLYFLIIATGLIIMSCQREEVTTSVVEESIIDKNVQLAMASSESVLKAIEYVSKTTGKNITKDQGGNSSFLETEFGVVELFNVVESTSPQGFQSYTFPL